MSARVVRLGAWCELVSSVGPRSSFTVHEFADLDDGTRVVLHTERGFTGQVHAVGGPPPDPWSVTDEDSIRRDVLTTVWPDDDDTQDEHPWDWLVTLLGAQGVAAVCHELQAVPYVVELGPAVSRRLDETSHLRDRE